MVVRFVTAALLIGAVLSTKHIRWGTGPCILIDIEADNHLEWIDQYGNVTVADNFSLNDVYITEGSCDLPNPYVGGLWSDEKSFEIVFYNDSGRTKVQMNVNYNPNKVFHKPNVTDHVRNIVDFDAGKMNSAYRCESPQSLVTKVHVGKEAYRYTFEVSSIEIQGYGVSGGKFGSVEECADDSKSSTHTPSPKSTASSTASTHTTKPSNHSSPTTHSTKPTTHSTKPTTHSTKPSNHSTKTSTHSTKPSTASTHTTKPSTHSSPTTHSTKPTTHSTKPTTHSTKPSNHSTKPSTYSTKPSTHSTKPSTHSTKPSTHSTKPSTHSTKPSTHSTKPSTHSTKPSTHSTKPSTHSTKPSTHSTRPTVRPIPTDHVVPAKQDFHIPCMKIDGKFQFNLSYPSNKPGVNLTALFAVNDIDTVTGSCGDPTTTIDVVYVTFYNNWRMNITVKRDNNGIMGNVEDDDNDVFWWSHVYLQYHYNTTATDKTSWFPNIDPKLVNGTVTISRPLRKKTFEAKQSGSYRCDAQTSIDLGYGSGLVVKNLQYAAFRSSPNITFTDKDVTECSADNTILKGNTYIYVGIGVIVLVAFVMTVYVAGRCCYRKEFEEL